MYTNNFGGVVKPSIISSISVRAAILAFATCAALAGQVMAADSPAEAPRKPVNYKPVKRNGVELFCRTDPVTGSRTQKKETCLTQAQVDAERNRGVNIITGK